MESELGKFERSVVPSTKDGIGDRIGEVVNTYSGKKKAADAAGVSPSTLGRWISGESSPLFHQLGRLVFKAGYSLDWVYSGVGSRRTEDRVQSTQEPPDLGIQEAKSKIDSYIPPVDETALEMAIEVLEKALDSQGYLMHPEDKAGMIVSNYELLRSSNDRATTLNQIRLILERTLARHGSPGKYPPG